MARSLFFFALITAATTLVSVGISRVVPFVAMAEAWLEDYRIATLLPAEPQSERIVLVTIDEATVRRFPYRAPVDRAFLARLVRTLERKGVAAIGLDVLFDQPTEPEKDAALKQVLETAAVPLVASFAAADDGLTADQARWLEAYLPARLRGWANLVKDGWDGTVRMAFTGRAGPDGVWGSSLAFALAERMGEGQPPAEPQVIAWHGRPSAEIPPFRKIPAMAAEVVPDAWFKGRIALIGADLSLTDRHPTPFATMQRGPGRLMPGVEIHAHALAQALSGRAPPSLSAAMKAVVVAMAAIAGVLLSRLPGGILVRATAGLVLTAGLWVGAFALYHAHGPLVPMLTPTLALALTLWATDAYGHRQERAMRKFVVDAFSRYVPPNVVARLVADPASFKLGGERRDIGILFTDVAGFTTLSEKADPETMGRLVNAYLGGVSKIVLAHDGTIVDFIGDAVLAIFGAPVAFEDYADRAVACARAIDAFSNTFRAQGLAAELDWGITRIGVHAGPVVIGNFGADLRCKYTPVGDAVNTASRLEGVNKYLGTRMLASAMVLCDRDRPLARPVGQLVVKGRSEPLEVFELLDKDEAYSDYMDRYRLAYRAFEQGDIEAALTGFSALATERPDDGCVAVHHGRLLDGRHNVLIHLRDK